MDQAPKSTRIEYMDFVVDEPTKRQQRQFDFGHDLSDLSNPEDPNWNNNKFRNGLGNYLERQHWGDVFTKLQHGDQVVFFSSPAIEMLKIKYLNDVIFGPQATDDIIARKREILSSEFRELAEEIGISYQNSLVLLQDFKQDVFRIPADINVNSDRLNAICTKVNKLMVDYIKSKLAEIRQKGQIKPAQQDFEENLDHGGGYRLTYGTTTVDIQTSDDLKSKVLALQRSYAMSTIARAGVEDDGYGQEYKSEDILKELNKIQLLKTELRELTITDSDGITHQIFSEDGLLDRDLLRLIRKEKFKCPPDQETLFNSIKIYIKSINLVDLLKPFTHDELIGGNLKEKINFNTRLAQKLKLEQELTNNERVGITDRVQSDAKDRNYTSADVFHAEAASQSHTSYIVIDALDVGLDQIRECEELIDSLANIQDSKEKIRAFEEVALKAGDKTTEHLRAIRQVIADTIKEDFGDKGKPILALVGGDELTLALENRPNNVEHERKIDALQFKIKKNLQKKLGDGTGVRMVRTVMARSDKNMKDDKSPGDDALVKAHRDALKRTEHGTDIAKKIEELERKIKKDSKYKIKILTDVSKDAESLIDTISRSDSDFIVKETEDNRGDFNIIDDRGVVILYTSSLNEFVMEQLK